MESGEGSTRPCLGKPDPVNGARPWLSTPAPTMLEEYRYDCVLEWFFCEQLQHFQETEKSPREFYPTMLRCCTSGAISDTGARRSSGGDSDR